MAAERPTPAERSASAVALGAVVLAVGGWLGCAHRGFDVEPASASTATVMAGGPGRQVLLRVRYRGVDGRGRLRLTLRRPGEERFQLHAADVLGRALWSLGSSGGETLMIDHRRREYCVFEGDVVVRAIALAELPVLILPRVLLGELPFAGGRETGSAELDVIDSRHRRWTATMAEDGHAVAWTLWQNDQAMIWWRKTDDGAILSHRGGAQVTWTLIADEILETVPPSLEPPVEYEPGHCDESDLS